MSAIATRPDKTNFEFLKLDWDLVAKRLILFIVY